MVSHIEYAVRYWPTEHKGRLPKRFEDEFRQAMRAIAGTGRALELNIGGPIRPWIPQWWAEEGGRAITLAATRTPQIGSQATSTRRWPWRNTSASNPAAVPKTSGPADRR